MSQSDESSQSNQQNTNSNINESNQTTNPDSATNVIDTAKGKHKVTKDTPVRVGSFGQINKYHSRNCRYVKNANTENIRPLTDQDLEFHSDLKECQTCKNKRTDTQTTKTGGDRSWFDKATDPDYT